MSQTILEKIQLVRDLDAQRNECQQIAQRINNFVTLISTEGKFIGSVTIRLTLDQGFAMLDLPFNPESISETIAMLNRLQVAYQQQADACLKEAESLMR